jgi:uncharacterized membrane protein YedE/YeeE
MTAPFEMADGLSFGLAFLFGIIFGLSLERAGLGDPHKLTGVFYLRDFTVPKVMFTAILVAATGLYLLSDVGLLDLERVYMIPTFFWPQLAGGAIFGIGFFFSGYCPGTAVAGLAAGRVDALVVMAGISLGTLLFAAVFPAIEAFYNSTDMGIVTLPEILGMNHWLVIAIMTPIASGMFAGMRSFEKRWRSTGRFPVKWIVTHKRDR